MKHAVYISVISLLVSSLGGCSYHPPKDVNSSFYAPPVGSQLQLHSALTIPPNDTQVYIQYGEIKTSYLKVDAYYSNCNFELHQIAEVARTVQPDVFSITRVNRDTENVMTHIPSVVASSSSGGGAPNVDYLTISSSANGAPSVDYLTIMDLHSPRQPDVMRITCRHWEDPSDSYHLSITQIRTTLGKLFTLSLPDDA